MQTSYILLPIILACLYLVGTLYARSAHDRTYYQFFSELYIVLTAIYLAPFGEVSLYMTFGVLLGAIALIFLLRWIVGDGRLLATGRLLERDYPILYYVCVITLCGCFFFLTPNRISPHSYRILRLLIPVLLFLLERVALFCIHRRQSGVS